MRNIIIGGFLILCVITVFYFVVEDVLRFERPTTETFVLKPTYCFAGKTLEQDDMFLKFSLNGNKIAGTMESYPSVGQSVQSALSGEIIYFDEHEVLIDALEYSGQNEEFIESRERRIELRDQVAFVSYGIHESENNGVIRWLEIPEQQCHEYDVLYREYFEHEEGDILTL